MVPRWGLQAVPRCVAPTTDRGRHIRPSLLEEARLRSHERRRKQAQQRLPSSTDSASPAAPAGAGRWRPARTHLQIVGALLIHKHLRAAQRQLLLHLLWLLAQQPPKLEIVAQRGGSIAGTASTAAATAGRLRSPPCTAAAAAGRRGCCAAAAAGPAGRAGQAAGAGGGGAAALALHGGHHLFKARQPRPAAAILLQRMGLVRVM